MKKHKITCLSCLCADVFDGTDIVRPGGEALNFAMNLHRHFPKMDVALMGAVGADIYGEKILDTLKETAIDLSCVYVDESHPTAHNITYLTPEGERYYKENSWTNGAHGAFNHLKEQDVQQLIASDVVFLNIYCPLFREVLALKKAHSFRLAVDFDTMNRPDRFEELAPCVDFFFISHKSGAEETLKKLSEAHDSLFNISLAEKGSVTYHHGKATHCPAVPVRQVVDTTGAGDSYHAGFVGEYLQTGDISKAMVRGSRVAAEVIGRYGGF